MKLRPKISLMLLIFVATSVVLVSFIQRLIVYPSFTSLEREQALQGMIQFEEALRGEIRRFGADCRDWASSDQLYDFVTKPSQHYIDSNLSYRTFANKQIELILIVTNTGDVVWGASYNLRSGESLTLLEFPFNERWEKSNPLLAVGDDDRNTRTLKRDTPLGLFHTRLGPMMISSQPILTGDKRGPVEGVLIIGKFLKSNTIQTISQQTRSSVDLLPVKGGFVSETEEKIIPRIDHENPYFVSEQDNNLLNIYTTMSDIEGKPAFLIKLKVHREVTKRGRGSMLFALLSVLFVCILLLMVLLVFLQKIVLKPIEDLTTHTIRIRTSNDLSARLTVPGHDEIGILAREFNTMVEELSDARKKLAEQSHHAGMVEVASGMLHNVRNAISPVFGQIQLLRGAIQTKTFRRVRAAQDELGTGKPSKERRDDLEQFVELAIENLVDQFEQTKTELGVVAERMAEIEKILSNQEQYSRYERAMETVRLDELVQDSLKLISRFNDSKIPIKVGGEIGGITPICIDRLSVLQVIVNCVINSLTSIQKSDIDDGLITIDIDTEVDNGKKSIHIHIADNGIGISADNLQNIFKRGFSTKPQGSSGMGLHWCANTVTRMNGRIYAESTGLRPGATLHILIPYTESIDTSLV